MLAEKKLRVSGSMTKLIVGKKNIVENIQNTIYYLEKGPKKSTLIIVPTEKKGDKIKQYPYGVALREKNSNEFDLYIDTFSEAIKKGIIGSEKIGNARKIFGVILGLALIMAMFVMFPIFVAALIISIFLYPISYLRAKRSFKHKQNIMNTIISMFESEFSTSDKKDTKDWITFWMKVKTETKELVTPI